MLLPMKCAFFPGGRPEGALGGALQVNPTKATLSPPHLGQPRDAVPMQREHRCVPNPYCPPYRVNMHTANTPKHNAHHITAKRGLKSSFAGVLW